MSATVAQTEDRRRVLDATDIVHLISEHVSLRAKGREFVGVCPFHDDHKPSMYVVPTKQIYHCFSCGAGGNAIDFVVHFHKMEFVEALRFLADRAGIELTPRRAGATDAEPGAPTRAELRAAAAFAQDFFRLSLAHPSVGAEARRTLERRGISPALVERFGIGAAPDSWDALLTTAGRKGVSSRALLEAGLIKPPKDGRGAGYDVFRRRLIFPIMDATGRPIAFGGRTLRDEDEPKYLNSPESPIFDKSATLFGLSLASRAIQKAGVAVVTEGYTDAIACHQAGFEHVVATLGTALTVGHARVLQRLCRRVVLLFDGDAAGAKAADRALEVFFSQPVDVAIAILPDGLDPADLLALPDGVERFTGLIEHTEDALAHRLDRLRERLRGTGLSERAAMVDEELARLVQIGLETQAPVRRRLIVRRIAQAVGVDEGTILDAMKRASLTRRNRAIMPAQSSTDADADADADRAVEPAVDPFEARSPAARAFAALLAEPSLLGELSDEERDILDPGAYARGPVRAMAEALASIAAADPDATGASGLDRIDDASARAFASGLVTRMMEETASDLERMRAHLHDFAARAMRARLARPGAGGAGVDALAERINTRRRLMARFGSDPLAIPRAGASAPASHPTPTTTPGEAST